MRAQHTGFDVLAVHHKERLPVRFYFEISLARKVYLPRRISERTMIDKAGGSVQPHFAPVGQNGLGHAVRQQSVPCNRPFVRRATAIPAPPEKMRPARKAATHVQCRRNRSESVSAFFRSLSAILCFSCCRAFSVSAFHSLHPVAYKQRIVVLFQQLPVFGRPAVPLFHLFVFFRAAPGAGSLSR